MKFNEKSPKTTVEKGEFEIVYPYCNVTIDDNGGFHANYSNPKDPNNSFKQTQNHNGGFNITHPDNEVKGLDTSMNPGRGSSYSGGGYNRHTGGHSEDSGENTKHSKYEGDTGHESGGDNYKGHAGSTFEGRGKDSFEHTTGGKTYKVASGSGGDHVKYIDCNTHEYTEGDHISSITGNRHVMVKDGEYGIHVQSGNMDTQVDDGKLRLKAGKDIIIDSDSTITLQVKNTKITISDGQITLSINNNKGIKITSGDVVITGTTYVGQSTINDKTGDPTTPFHSP